MFMQQYGNFDERRTKPEDTSLGDLFGRKYILSADMRPVEVDRMYHRKFSKGHYIMIENPFGVN